MFMSTQVPDFLENIKTRKFVLIHGEGFGAWCWYKTIALLEEAGLSPIAFDLKGSGIDLADTNSLSTLAEYSKPLFDYLQNLEEDEKVRRWLSLLNTNLCITFVLFGRIFCHLHNASNSSAGYFGWS